MCHYNYVHIVSDTYTVLYILAMLEYLGLEFSFYFSLPLVIAESTHHRVTIVCAIVGNYFCTNEFDCS